MMGLVLLLISKFILDCVWSLPGHKIQIEKHQNYSGASIKQK